MYTPLNRKKNPYKGKNVSRPKFEELEDEYKEAIINHEDCAKVFAELRNAVRLPVSEHIETVLGAFEMLLPELADIHLNISEGEHEYKPFFELLMNKHEGEYPVNTGLFVLIQGFVRRYAGKFYCSSIAERYEVFKACDKLAIELKETIIPIRDKCIADFYEAATPDQWDDIRMTVKHHQNPKDTGMPGNNGMMRFPAQ